MIRQGDILLVPVAVEPPEDVRPAPLVVLAEGELTGHAHRLRGDVLDWTAAGERYVHVLGEPGTLQHEDHDPVPAAVVEPGQTYRVVRQREWSLEGQWRRVAD